MQQMLGFTNKILLMGVSAYLRLFSSLISCAMYFRRFLIIICTKLFYMCPCKLQNHILCLQATENIPIGKKTRGSTKKIQRYYECFLLFSRVLLDSLRFERIRHENCWFIYMHGCKIYLSLTERAASCSCERGEEEMQ